MKPLLALYVSLAGAAGTFCRYAIGVGLSRWSTRFPWGTFAVNLVGSFAIGYVMALFAARGELDSRARMALTTGFMGGFTTYSAFAYETVDLIERKHAAMAALYVGTTLWVAAAACALGMASARAMR